jgi:hypothetical protein
MTRKLPVTPMEVFWSFGVTGSFLDIGSYWEFSCDWELLEIVWSLRLTGSCLGIGSYWKFSGHWSQYPENFQ